jgi:hypothetical protein
MSKGAPTSCSMMCGAIELDPGARNSVSMGGGAYTLIGAGTEASVNTETRLADRAGRAAMDRRRGRSGKRQCGSGVRN